MPAKKTATKKTNDSNSDTNAENSKPQQDNNPKPESVVTAEMIKPGLYKAKKKD